MGVPEQIAGRAESCLLVRAQTTPPTGFISQRGQWVSHRGKAGSGGVAIYLGMVLGEMAMILSKLFVENGRTWRRWVWEIQTERSRGKEQQTVDIWRGMETETDGLVERYRMPGSGCREGGPGFASVDLYFVG